MDFKKSYESVRTEVLYYILFVFVIPMELLRQIKMCRNETYTRVRAGTRLSTVFPNKNDLQKGNFFLSFFVINP
jgi:hypothetical protein